MQCPRLTSIKLLLPLLFISGALRAQVALGGLYTPVQLKPDSTLVYLRDYLAEIKADSIQLPAGLYDHHPALDTLLLSGDLAQKFALLRIYSAKGAEALPLISSSAKEVEIRFPANAFPDAHTIRVIGDFNNWNRDSAPLKNQNGFYRLRLYLEPGRYAYKLLVDGEEILDPTAAEKIPNGLGSFNNRLEVEQDGQDPGAFTFQWEEKSGAVQLEDPFTQILVFWENKAIDLNCTKSTAPRCLLSLPEEARHKKRSFLRIYSFTKQRKGRNQLIPLHYGKPLQSAEQLERSDWHQARLYFLMVDRFKNGNHANDRLTPDEGIQPKANYYGGDLAGLSQVLQAGYFEQLGVNTLWLSPITQNPLDAWGYWDKGALSSKFSAYHGYWPISNVRIDHRFGDSATLAALINQAHEQDCNVLLDYVANHVHQDHPIYQKHPDWATPLYLPDGSKNTEKWDQHRLSTWFDDHLPTLDLSRYTVVDPLVDSALFWLTHFELDGFRHDATKHIDELYWRTLTYRIRKKTDRKIYQIGETYGSPELINSYLSTGMLDAQFDFNLYDAAVYTFAKSKNLPDLKNTLEAGLQTYGYHHLMGNISGNQDRSRFISLASGDVRFNEDQKLAGWERAIGTPSPEAYKRLALLLAFNYSVPGIPCLYYGDEIGLPGANDPDNRRMMYFDQWTLHEQALFEKVQALNRARAEQLPLLYGSTEMELLGPEAFLIRRRYLHQEVVVLFNLSNKARYLSLPGKRAYEPLSSTPAGPSFAVLPSNSSAKEKVQGHRVAGLSYLMLKAQ